ncbi:putative membrane protein [Halobacteriovorax marinus SJ]|uniref:Membrane protein n=1 Tax=Halobacteriovorax marinus (strain ATCC BAA-682 / DSM 15412 / SJ) TaxID=862908 RepID=E1X5P9_HALMS|nr:hypothetical protein [Halobacteriovorax marinus]CBW25616.1 putative membrane protein [Halobacteriovorax marinus SJ]
MNQILREYILTFLHPFKTHEVLRERVSKERPLTLASELQRDEENEIIGLSFVEALSVSWVMAMINGIYSIGLIYFGYLTGVFMSENDSLSSLIGNGFSLEYQKVLVSWSIMQVIIFPITLWFYAKVWTVIIKFFGSLFEFDGDLEQSTAEIVNQSMVSNLFLVIPIFGEMIRHFSSIIYLFAGLRNNMSLSILQSLIVICSPLIIFVLFITFVIIYFTSLFAML